MRWIAKVVDNRLKLEGSSYEEAGAEIHAKDDGTFDLFEITQFAVAMIYDDNYKNINEAIKMAESWT
jgi:hypothetical protein